MLQQSALQINFPLHQQHFDTAQSRHLEEPQAPQGFIDESGNLCLLQLSETVDGVASAAKHSTSRHGASREKTRSSQKRRKKKKVKQQAKREFGK